jgi:hypothetical protein
MTLYVTIWSHDEIGGKVPLNATGPRLVLEILVDNIRVRTVHINLFHHTKLDTLIRGKFLDFGGTAGFLLSCNVRVGDG